MDFEGCPSKTRRPCSCSYWLTRLPTTLLLPYYKLSLGNSPGTPLIRLMLYPGNPAHKTVLHSYIWIFLSVLHRCCWKRKTETHSGRLPSDLFSDRHPPANTWNSAQANPPF